MLKIKNIVCKIFFILAPTRICLSSYNVKLGLLTFFLNLSVDSVMEVSVSSLIGNLMCTSRTRWGCNVSSVERIVSHLTFKGLSLVSSHRLARQPLLEPCDMEFRLELLWPAWLPRSLLSSLPHSQVILVFNFFDFVLYLFSKYGTEKTLICP